MTESRVEMVCRKLCEANGVNPDDLMLATDYESPHKRPMWRSFERPAKEHIAAFEIMCRMHGIAPFND